MVRIRLVGILAATVVAALLAAGSGGAAPHAATAQTFVYCSDITYPPEEFYKGTTAVGSDIDIGAEVAKRIGMKAKFNNTGFTGIIAALLAKKCDAIISGMNDTAARRQQVAFVDYLSVGQSLMVKKGNPKGIKTLADLSGKTVSVEVGTTNKQFLDAQNKVLSKQGKPAIKITTFPADTDAANALKTGRVDAYFGDSPVVAYYIARDSSFAFAGSPINPIPVGIALRKGDSRIPAVRKAIAGMYADGTMTKILKKWKMEAFALKK
ncbi:MAG: ABC transporter substrate-binding protein [Gaiellaceae bacterium]